MTRIDKMQVAVARLVRIALVGGVIRGAREMKIRIDKARCVGNARCWAIAPDLYPLDDDGYIAIEEFEVPAGQEELAKRGARACPERVIEIIEE